MKTLNVELTQEQILLLNDLLNDSQRALKVKLADSNGVKADDIQNDINNIKSINRALLSNNSIKSALDLL